MKAIFALILMCFTLIGCSGGGDSEPTEVGNFISVFGVDGPMAEADVAIYSLKDYLEDSAAAVHRLKESETTDPQTGLADNLELALDAGLGPFIVIITANDNTIDLSTGRAPEIREVRTIVESLPPSDVRIYATPLTTAAVAIASHGQTVADDVLENLFGDEAVAQNVVKAFFGFGMDEEMDIFSIPPILDENARSKPDQEAVAYYRGALEALSAVLASLADSDNTADALFKSLIDDAIDNGMLDNTEFISAIEGFNLDALISRFADKNITTIAQLLDGELTQLRDYRINPTVDVVPSSVIDSDLDGAINADDAFDFDPLETLDSDGDGVGNNADAFPDNNDETVDSDKDGVGDNSDRFPDDPSEVIDSDGDGLGDNSDVFPDDSSETIDSDGDGVGDNSDHFPEDPTETVDFDGDGYGNDADNCPNRSNGDQQDGDGDGVGDACDYVDSNQTHYDQSSCGKLFKSVCSISLLSYGGLNISSEFFSSLSRHWAEESGRQVLYLWSAYGSNLIKINFDPTNFDDYEILFPVNRFTVGILSDDYDLDGDFDLIRINSGAPWTSSSTIRSGAYVYENVNGRISTGIQFSEDVWYARNPFLTDYDADGDNDIFVWQSSTNLSGHVVFENLGELRFAPPVLTEDPNIDPAATYLNTQISNLVDELVHKVPPLPVDPFEYQVYQSLYLSGVEWLLWDYDEDEDDDLLLFLRTENTGQAYLLISELVDDTYEDPKPLYFSPQSTAHVDLKDIDGDGDDELILIGREEVLVLKPIFQR